MHSIAERRFGNSLIGAPLKMKGYIRATNGRITLCE